MYSSKLFAGLVNPAWSRAGTVGLFAAQSEARGSPLKGFAHRVGSIPGYGWNSTEEQELEHLDRISQPDPVISIGVAGSLALGRLTTSEEEVEQVDCISELRIGVPVAADGTNEINSFGCFTGIPDSVTVLVGLVRVGSIDAIVAFIADSIAIGVFLSRVGHYRAIVHIVEDPVLVAVG